MKVVKWEAFEDSRSKYAGEDPGWHKVYIENPLTPLGAGWKFNYCVLGARFKPFMDSIINYEVNKDDVWICSFPKSGTTWTQEMVWLVQNGFNFEEAKEKLLYERSPTLRQIITDQEQIKQNQVDHYSGLSKLSLKFKRPYMIKNHLPVGFLPKSIWTVKPKIVYVTRNPKDVVVSFFNHYRDFFKYSGSLEEFFGLFLDDLVEFGPWADHIKEYWQLRDEDNILFLTYEDMKKDLPGCIRKTAKFLDKPVTDEQIEKSVKFLHIDNMREGSSVQWVKAYAEANNVSPEVVKQYAKQFFRKGETGGYKKEMSQEVIDKFDELIHRELGDNGPY